ncbi:uncharacterized protein SPPG_03788 [Spizellomyces punctatus DAOM BR117]|uniref:Rho-GAP domain-containing protein n=1 Tax=Spizellomyces punctatus (strain DAOM BR117) TaxID=645134 RepID=A0A0L0HIG7_SPIPD|nr:uncharacterized protein SPPG_03788 [Spizellomyces punctatus DAOM BR117]KND00665.1 hypothetical protein SPPG_03788 [Spizellomyces punctatus DAOM BR117]|eukprot:XP_016608704.1 hypothetical protein SPPG_03788 [Spizellomyces punctatus DAOM BR117]
MSSTTSPTSPIHESAMTHTAEAKRVVDTGTQTEVELEDAESQATLSITIPHSQLSFFHIEEAGKGRKEKKRMSAIIVSSSGTDGTVTDDVSVLSISLSSRYSVSSVKSIKSPDKPFAAKNSIIISGAEQMQDKSIAIDLLPSSKLTAVTAPSSLPTRTKDSELFPIPAYEEVANNASPGAEEKAPSSVIANDVSMVTRQPSTATLNDSNYQPESQMNSSSVRQSITALPKLPPLNVHEIIVHPEAASMLRTLSLQWPVLKCGLLLRKEVLASSSASMHLRSLDRPSAVRMVGRSLGTLLKGKRRTRGPGDYVESRPAYSTEDDEWNLFYAEVRGRYLMFYVLQEPPRQNSSPVNPGTGAPPLPAKSAVPAKGPSQVTAAGRDGLLHKPFTKLFNTLGKKARSDPARKSSADLAAKLFRNERSSVDDVRRPSNEQQRTILANLTPDALKDAPRTLVHYLPLHKALVEPVPQARTGAMTSPGNSSSFVSTSSCHVNSHLVLSTTPVERHHEAGLAGAKCDQVLLDIVLHEDILLDHNELTVSTVNSTMRDTHARRQEIQEWMTAIRTVSDFQPPSYDPERVSLSPSLVENAEPGDKRPESIHHEKRAGPLPVQMIFKENSSISSIKSSESAQSLKENSGNQRSPSVEELPEPLDSVARDERQKGPSSPASFPSSALLNSPLPPTLTDSLPAAEPLILNTVAADASVRASHPSVPAPGNKSFAKLISNKWKMTFEKEKEPARAKPVISGPTNFTKLEVSPEMLVKNAAAISGPISGSPPSRSKLDMKPLSVAGEKELVPSSEPSVNDSDARRKDDRRKGEKAPRTNVHKKKSHKGEEKDPGSNVVASKKDREKERKREGKDKSKFHKASSSSFVISAPIAVTASDSTGVHQQQPQKIHPPASDLDQQPSVSTSRLFFPFFNKSLFTPKEKESLAAISPAADILKRTATVSSRASTVRRRVGKSRPPSSGTMASDRGTIGSAVRDGQGRVPLELRKCIALVEDIGMETEGLYRISGSAASVERLRRLLMINPSNVYLQAPPTTLPLSSPLSAMVTAEIVAAAEKIPSLPHRSSRLSLAETVSSARSSVDFGPSLFEMRRASRARRLSTSSIPPGIAGLSGPSLYDNDIHVVTGVIKGFLRDGLGSKKLPICTFDAYEDFISATQIGDWRSRMIAIQDLVHSLPANHFATLKFICEHLNRVASKSEKNRMSVRNLSIIFGPTLLRPPPALDSMARIIEDMPFQCTVVETLIEQVDWVFGPIEYEEVEEVVEYGDLEHLQDLVVADDEEDITSNIVVGGTESNQNDVASDCGVVGSADGSTVGVDKEIPHTENEPTSLPEAADLPNQQATDLHPEEGGNTTGHPAVPSGGRLRHTKSKLDRRRGHILPSMYLNDLCENMHVDTLGYYPVNTTSVSSGVDPSPRRGSASSTSTPLQRSQHSPSSSSASSTLNLPPLPAPSQSGSVTTTIPPPTPTSLINTTRVSSSSGDHEPPRLSLNLDIEERSFLDI